MNFYDIIKRIWDYLTKKTICPEGFWKSCFALKVLHSDSF